MPFCRYGNDFITVAFNIQQCVYKFNHRMYKNIEIYV